MFRSANIAKELLKVAKLLMSDEMTPEEKIRRRKKVDAVRNLANNIIKLRRKVNKDIKSDDEKNRLTATVVSIMDKTAERVGNDNSAAVGHVGVTGFKKRHVEVDDNTVYFKYTGKSGVKHEKKFTDKSISNIVRDCITRTESDDDFLFVTSKGFKIKADKVNRYLSDFGVKAKDIRGYAANRLVTDALKRTEGIKDEKERQKKFREVIKSVSDKVGHSAQTLRLHYLLPNLEEEYVKKGKIMNIKEAKIEEE